VRVVRTAVVSDIPIFDFQHFRHPLGHFRHRLGHFRNPQKGFQKSPTSLTSPRKDFRHFRQAPDMRPIAEVARKLGHRQTSLPTKNVLFSRQ
jgi:hypothetical protein